MIKLIRNSSISYLVYYFNMKIFFDKHLFVARHGQTVWNLEERYQGRHNSDLTDEGIREAHLLGSDLADKDINLVISSQLKRARETAEILLNYLKPMQVIEMLAFRERDYGIYEGKTRDEVQLLYPEFHEANITHSWITQPPGAESLRSFEKRVIQGLSIVKELYYPKNILIVTHAGVIRMIRKYFEDLGPGEAFSNLPGNCSLLNY